MGDSGMQAKQGDRLWHIRHWFRVAFRQDARSRLSRHYSSDRDAFLTGVMEGAELAVIVVLPVGLLILWLCGWLP